MGPGVAALRSIAALLGACGVVLGAFGAHALRDGFSATQLGLWQTAVSYLFWHVLAALLALQRDASSAAACSRWRWRRRAGSERSRRSVGCC